MSEELAVEDKARQMGWADKDAWRGNPDQWVDAEEFVRRGEQIMPILKKNNETMHQTITRLQQQIEALSGQVAAGQESMKAMEEIHAADVKRQVERAKVEIREQLKAAREIGDTDAEMQLMDQLTDVNAQLKSLKEEPGKKQAPAQAPQLQLDPATQNWLQVNPWFAQDPQSRKSLYAMGIANEYAKAGRPITAEMYADLDAELAKVFGDGNPRRDGASKVEGGRSESGGGSRKGYAALPQEAKVECDKQASRLVGEGRRFKTTDDYRTYYAKMYFSEE